MCCINSPNSSSSIHGLAQNFFTALISGHRRPTDLSFIDSDVGEETPLSALMVGGGHR
jgi:hypothetical protein